MSTTIEEDVNIIDDMPGYNTLLAKKDLTLQEKPTLKQIRAKLLHDLKIWAKEYRPAQDYFMLPLSDFKLAQINAIVEKLSAKNYYVEQVDDELYVGLVKYIPPPLQNLQ
jgi:hypothetical protein